MRSVGLLLVGGLLIWLGITGRIEKVVAAMVKPQG